MVGKGHNEIDDNHDGDIFKCLACEYFRCFCTRIDSRSLTLFLRSLPLSLTFLRSSSLFLSHFSLFTLDSRSHSKCSCSMFILYRRNTEQNVALTLRVRRNTPNLNTKQFRFHSISVLTLSLCPCVSCSSRCHSIYYYSYCDYYRSNWPCEGDRRANKKTAAPAATTIRKHEK